MFRLMILVNQTGISCWEWARWIDKLINNVYIWSMLGFMAVILSQGAKEKGRPGDIFLGGGEKPNGFRSQDKSLNHLQASFEICLAQCWDLRCSPLKKINMFLLFPQKTCFFLQNLAISDGDAPLESYFVLDSEKLFFNFTNKRKTILGLEKRPWDLRLHHHKFPSPLRTSRLVKEKSPDMGPGTWNKLLQKKYTTPLKFNMEPEHDGF